MKMMQTATEIQFEARSIEADLYEKTTTVAEMKLDNEYFREELLRSENANQELKSQVQALEEQLEEVHQRNEALWSTSHRKEIFESMQKRSESAMETLAACQARAEDLCTCPITQQPMVEPVVAADGQSYERTAIERWFRNHTRSPVTNLHLDQREVFTNRLARTFLNEAKLSVEILRSQHEATKVCIRHLDRLSMYGSSTNDGTPRFMTTTCRVGDRLQLHHSAGSSEKSATKRPRERRWSVPASTVQKSFEEKGWCEGPGQYSPRGDFPPGGNASTSGCPTLPKDSTSGIRRAHILSNNERLLMQPGIPLWE